MLLGNGKENYFQNPSLTLFEPESDVLANFFHLVIFFLIEKFFPKSIDFWKRASGSIDSLYPRKLDLIGLTPYHWKFYVLNFRNIEKG